jgi:hypothetical protein
MSWRFYLKERKMFTEDLSAFELIGEGTIRCCYKVPDKPLCLKFYVIYRGHDIWHPRSLKTRMRLALTRHLFWFNINMQEWRYYERLKRRLPAELMSVFPEHMEPLYSPRYGWGLTESMLTSYDGSYAQLADEELARLRGSSLAEELYRDIEKFFDQAVHYAIALFDPRNILIQWVSPQHYRIRLVDFEPKPKTLIPGLAYLKPFIRFRVRTRSSRYLALLRMILEKGPTAKRKRQ